MNRSALKIFTALLFMAIPCMADADCPDENSIYSLAENSKRSYLDFLSESLLPRLSLVYNEGVLPEKQKANLLNITQKYTEQLSQILSEQLKCKKQIEDYAGNDWEQRFEATGLWNKLKTDLLNSKHWLRNIESYGAERKELEIFQQEDGEKQIDDFENNTKIAFAQLRQGSDEYLKKVIEKWPESKDLLGSIFLEKLSRLDDYSEMTTTEITLACQQAITEDAENYLQILLKLSGMEKFQLPEVFYAAALSIEKENPPQAMELFSKAGENKKALELAYKLYNENQLKCDRTATIFENYLASTPNDCNTLYCYAFILKDCDRESDSIEIFEQIANSQGSLALNAEYEIIQMQLKSGADAGSAEKKLETLLHKFHNAPEDLPVKSLALQTYCGILLNHNCPADAEKVLSLLEKGDMPLLRARALWILNEKEKCITELLKAEFSTGDDLNFCISVLNNIRDNLDELAETGGNAILAKSILLSDKITPPKNSGIIAAELLKLEFQIAEPNSNPGELKIKIDETEKQLDPENNNLLRIRARLLTRTGDFEQAYNLWSKLLSKQPPDNSFRPEKYYQLLCLSQISAQGSQKAAHAAEVLLNSQKDISEFWQKKLQNLAEPQP